MNVKYMLTPLVIVASGVSSFSYAYDCEVKEHKKIALVYANGMLNKSRDRRDALADSYLKLKEIYFDDNRRPKNVEKDDFKKVKPVFAINKSETFSGEREGWTLWGGFKETLEVVLDYGLESPAVLTNYLLSFITDNEKDSVLGNAYRDFLSRVESKTDKDLKEQIDQYEELMDRDGYKVLTISHSHGNIITKKVHDYFISQKEERENNFRLLSVGSPIKMARANMFLLDTKDPIGYISWTIDWSEKVKNKSVYKPKTGDYSYHSYLTYLHGSDSSSAIDEFFIKGIESFDFSDSLIGEEIVRIELEKTDPGMKLYVHEQYTGVDQSINYYVGDDLEYVKGKLDKVFYGFGEFTTTSTKDTYSLTCDELVKMGNAGAVINGYVYSPYNDKTATFTMISKRNGMSGEYSSFAEAYIPRYDNTGWNDYVGAHMGEVSSIPNYYLHDIIKSEQYVLKWSQYGHYKNDNPDATPKPLL